MQILYKSFDAPWMYFSTFPCSNRHEPLFSIWGIQCEEETFMTAKYSSNISLMIAIVMVKNVSILWYVTWKSYYISSRTAPMFCGITTLRYLYSFWTWFLFEDSYDRLLFIFGVIDINLWFPVYADAMHSIWCTMFLFFHHFLVLINIWLDSSKSP